MTNSTRRRPVVFIRSPLEGGWDHWCERFEEAGYEVLTRGDSRDQILAELLRKPAVIGHGIGASVAADLAHRGLCAASVAISPARWPEAKAALAEQRAPLLLIAASDDSLTSSPGWEKLADAALAFVERFAPAALRD